MKKLQSLGRVLSKVEQKRVIGGDDYGQICLGCSTTQECRAVNKGDCVEATCNNKKAYYCDMS